MSGKRVETEISTTAKLTCVSRAASSLESNSCYRSDDYIALLHIPPVFRFLFRIHPFRRLFFQVIAPKGVYEYTIARTKYIDAVFKKIQRETFDQILIFGAGFDSRAVRFQAEIGDTKIFELDAPVTQQAKIDQYRKLGIETPSNLVFLPIDFDKESLPEKLERAGFRKGKKCLFVMEGLLMYLQKESVDETFRVVETFAGAGSVIVFDYVRAEVLRGDGLHSGDKEIMNKVSQAGEQWTFGFEEGKVEVYLGGFGLNMLEHTQPAALERMYFTDEKGVVVGRVNGAHNLVKAVAL
jgi:methyltransferase (TIGR00027 family)